MNAFAPGLFTPQRLVWVALLLTAVGVGICIPLLRDLKLQMQVILSLGFAGLALLLVVPNRRLLLVCAWVFAHPLSLEKVFQIFPADYQGFIPPSLVISGTDLILYTLAVVMVCEAALTDRKVFRWPGAATPYALLVAWVGFVFMLKGAPIGTGIIQLIHWAKMLLFLLVLSAAIRNRDELLTVLLTVAVAVLLQSIVLGVSYVLDRKFGFSDKASSATMMGFTGGDGAVFTRATGTVGHVNQQAMFHTFFTIPLVALFMVRNWIWRAFMAVVLVGSLCAVILTFSRASWVSCLLAAGVIVFLGWRHRRISSLGWLGMGAGALLALMVVGAFSGLIFKRLTRGDDGATSSRVRAALLALEHVSYEPITGVGPGNFVNAKLARTPLEWVDGGWVPRGQDFISRDVGGLELQEVNVQGRWFFWPGVVHNEFLLTAAELGLVGLALFLWFQWRVLRHALSALRSSDRLQWWCAAALTGVFWASQTEYMLEHFYEDKAMLAPMFVITLMVSLDRIASADIERERAV